ncbi:hypothetical protein [Ramlibacter humi]|uniref:Uncharacterized protein n=1 Tax=Ramlibacter humi TaxID=2530451 RepID=A0A4Z0BQK1_9BURK|nr:hypothetical protein [Ramlibacter humi]TFZ00269.1 hypothetical protein EZ216_14310 [Ramlibacter humi]
MLLFGTAVAHGARRSAVLGAEAGRKPEALEPPSEATVLAVADRTTPLLHSKDQPEPTGAVNRGPTAT